MRCIICVIVVKQPKAHVTRRQLKACFTFNPDGAGFMWAANNNLYVLKGFFTFRSFYKTFRAKENKYPNSIFVAHFRIATSGLDPITGCHPHLINKNLAFVHNGVLVGLGAGKLSDTQDLCSIFARYPDNFMSDLEIVNCIEEYAKAGWNKFVFLDNKGRLTIFNEDSGHWKGDIWFSNLTWEWSSNYKQYNNAWDNMYCGSYKNSYDKCTVCNKWYKSYLMRRLPALYRNKDQYICDACWDLVLANTEIYCPKCYNPIILTSSGKCPYCSEQIYDTDIIPYLTEIDNLFG